MVEPSNDLKDADESIAQGVANEHVEAEGLDRINDGTWAVYGSTPVDGEVLVAEFNNRAEAESSLEQIAADEGTASS